MNRLAHRPATPTTPTATSPWPALTVVLVGPLLAILDTFIVLAAIPTIQHELHATDAEVQYILAGYQLTYAVALITGARLGDRYGRRRMFITGMAVFVASSLACGAAPSPVALIAARLVQGLGAAVMFPQVFAMIHVLFPAERRHRAFAALGAVIGVSSAAGAIVGGLLIVANIAGTTWRPVFWVNIPIGVAAMLLAVKVVPESRAPAVRRLDLRGAAVLITALVLLVVPIIDGRQAGWPWWTWASLAAAPVVAAVFVWVERCTERDGRDPLVSTGLLTDRPFTIGILLVLTTYAGINSFFLILSLLLQAGLGLSPLDTGLLYLPIAIAFFAASLIAGWATPRYRRHTLDAGAALAAIGFAATITAALTGGNTLGVGALIPGLVLVGAGNGLLTTPLVNTVLAKITPDAIGTASGVLSTAQQIGGALGVAAIGVAFYGTLPTTAHHPVSDYGHAFGSAVTVNLALALLALLLLRPLSHRRQPVSRRHTMTARTPHAVVRGHIVTTVEPIRDHPAQPWTLNALAQEVHLSRSQPARSFGATLGMTAMTYLRRMRVKRMARLLASTDVSVAEAARSVGWSNPSYASRCFHQHYGVSPTEYRRRQSPPPIRGTLRGCRTRRSGPSPAPGVSGPRRGRSRRDAARASH